MNKADYKKMLKIYLAAWTLAHRLLKKEFTPLLYVLFDLNGTLVHRAQKRFQKEEGQAYEPVGTDSAKRPVYVRPGAAELLAKLVADERVEVMFYTSTMMKNSFRMANTIVRAYTEPVPSVLGDVPVWVYEAREDDHQLTVADWRHNKDGTVPFVLERWFNKLDPEGEEAHDTVRDMDKVWQIFGAIMGPENTLLVDNEVRKVREVPHNAAVVHSFEADGVAGEDTIEGFGTMSALHDWVYDLVEGLDEGSSLHELVQSSPFDKERYDLVPRV